MALTQIPSVPMEKAVYDLEKLTPDVNAILSVYPVTFRCVACGTCNKACPQNLPVMDYIQSAMRGDIAAVADMSFDCVACGLCALRCPAEIIQHEVGILSKRLTGRYLRKESKELDDRLEEINSGKYNSEYVKLMGLDKVALSELYYGRDVEP
jgi:ferredoxin